MAQPYHHFASPAYHNIFLQMDSLINLSNRNQEADTIQDLSDNNDSVV
jgi:hypothetical protein